MAGFQYAPTYQDYLRLRGANDQSGFSESGSSNLPDLLSEDQFNALTPQQQFGAINSFPTQLQGGHSAGGGLFYELLPSDPRYAQLAQQVGADPQNGGIDITMSAPSHMGDPNYWVNPSHIVGVGNGFYAFDPQNMTPRFQVTPTDWGYNIIQALTGLAWGAAGADALSGGSLLGNAGSTADISTSDLGSLAPSGYGGTGGTTGANLAATGGSSLPDSYWSATAQNGMSDVPLDVGTGNPTGVFAPGMEQQGLAESNLLNAGITPGSQEWIRALAAQGLDTSGGTSLLSHFQQIGNRISTGDYRGLLGDAGSWALHHPLQAVGLAQTAMGLLHGNGSTGSTSSGSKPSGTGTGLPQSGGYQGPTFQQNPFLLAQIQRGYQ